MSGFERGYVGEYVGGEGDWVIGKGGFGVRGIWIFG